MLAPTATGHCLTVDEQFTRIEGIEIEMVALLVNSDECIRCDGDFNGLVVDKCLMTTAVSYQSDIDGIYVYNKN